MDEVLRVRIPATLKARLEELATADNRTLSNYVRHLLQEASDRK